jgi:hypothetical protein
VRPLLCHGLASNFRYRTIKTHAMIPAMCIQIAPAEMADIHQVLADHHRYWGERDLRSLHLLALVKEFGSTCLIARAEDGIHSYIIGFVTRPAPGMCT